MHAIKSSFFFGIVEKDFEDLVQLQTVTAFASVDWIFRCIDDKY